MSDAYDMHQAALHYDWLAGHYPYMQHPGHHPGYGYGHQPQLYYPQRARVGAIPLGLVAATVAGLSIFGGLGALAGFLIGRTQTAALAGAIVGLVTPPVVSALVAP